MECINILFMGNIVYDKSFVKVRGERRLSENTVNIVSCVKLVNKLKELFLGCIFRKLVYLGFKAYLVTSLALVSYINL